MTETKNDWQKWSYLIILVLLSFTCELQREYDGELFPTGEQKMVCIAVLGNETAPTAYLFPTTEFLDTSSAQFVEDAIVELWQGGNRLTGLTFEDNRYVSLQNIPINGKDTFQLQVRHPDYEDLLSAAVVVPDDPVITTANWAYNADSSRITAILIIDDARQAPNGYVLSTQLFADEPTMSLGTGAVRVSVGLLLDDNQIQYEVSLPTQVTIFDNLMPIDTVSVSQAKIDVRHVSEEFYRYNATISTGEFGGFFPPQDTLYSNFSGGHGVFFTQSTNSYLIEL